MISIVLLGESKCFHSVMRPNEKKLNALRYYKLLRNPYRIK